MKIRARVLALLCLVSALGWSRLAGSAVGPYGGWINDLKEDASGRVLAACSFGGIYRTSDDGESWTQIYDDLTDFDPLCIAVNSSGHIFVGAEGYLGDGIRRSTDDGMTWQLLSNALSSHGARVLRVMPNGDIFACTFYDEGLYRSTDNGSTFSLVSSLPALFLTDLERNSNGHLFVGTRLDGSRAYRSTDGGTSWQLANQGLAGDVNDIFITPSNVLYAATTTGLFISTDNGTTWTNLNAPGARSYRNVVVVPDGTIFAAFTAAVVVGGGVYRSADAGATWTQESGLPAKATACLLRTSSGALFSGGLGQGVYRRASAKDSAGADWEWKNHGLANTFVTAIDQDAITGKIYAGTAHAQVFSSTDGGLTWQRAGSGIPEYEWINALAVNIEGSVFASGAYGGIYRSTDGGLSWTTVSAVAATALACSASGHVFAGTGPRIYRSLDNGATWTFSTLSSVQNIADIAFDGTTVYVATGTPFGFGSQGIRRSTDNGSTWAAYNDGLTNMNVTCVVVGLDPPGSPSRICCGTDGSGVFCLDEGAVGKAPGWNPCDIAPAPASVVAMERRRALRVGELNRLRTEAGLPAQPCTGDLADIKHEIRELYERLDDDKSQGDRRAAATVAGTLLVGTSGGGIVMLPSSPVGVGGTDWVRRGTLTQNHPNPFNPRTEISFVVDEYGPVALRVYDVHGREVATLLDAMKAAGSYELTWDAADRPSGVYYYQLTVGEEVATRKMVLLK